LSSKYKTAWLEKIGEVAL